MEVINLKKGQTIDLRKNSKGESVYDLSQVTIGLGWDIRTQKKSFLSKIIGSNKQDDYDLDAIAFCLNKNEKIFNLGEDLHINERRIPFQKSDIVYFSNLTAPSGNYGAYRKLSKKQIQSKVNKFLSEGEYIVHTGDNLTGEGEGDDEQIIVRLDSLPSRIEKLIFLVSIYKGLEKNQHFGMVENAFIRAVDAKGKEIARYSLSSQNEFDGMCSMTFAEIYKKDGIWKFRALGVPHKTDLFVHILKPYIN
jgi:tellurium resistance protein TerD